MKISSCSFGKCVCESKTYSADLVIYPDHVDDLWWREQSHLLSVGDLKEAIDARPDILVVGTGQFGMMKIDDALKSAMQESGIQLIWAKTKEACELFNKYSREGKKVIGAFHLTC